MKKLNMTVALALALCALVAVLSKTESAQADEWKGEPDAPGLITAEMVKPHIVKLADDKYEGRGAGYEGERKAGEYIAGEFKRIGLKPLGDSVRNGRRGYFQEFKFHPYHPTAAWEVRNSRNVLGFIEGSDPTLKNEIIVIGAHYDGQGRAGQADPTRQPASGTSAPVDEIWNSANDNATSVAAVLEIARAIKHSKVSVKRSILFIAFGAEEHGMSGSIFYIQHPAFPLNQHVAMINLEKLGRSPEKPLSADGGASSPAWAEVFKAAQARTQVRVQASSPYTFPDSDHYPFGASRIPAVILSVHTSADAHQPSDTSDKIDFARTAEAARYAMAMLLELADRPARPEYVASPIPDLGLIAHLVTSQEADAAGLGAEESGLKVTGVIAGLPSSDAGLREGDLILEVAKHRFRRDDKLAELIAMQRQVLEGKLGYKLPVTIQRDKKRSELMINLRR